MTVTYLPPITSSHAQLGESLLREAVAEGPGYARSRVGTRWHMVRSAYDALREWDDEIVRLYQFWCGQSTSSRRRPWIAEAPPDEEPVCGTCYGRSEGARKEREDLLFSPRVEPPRMCPGSRKEWFREVPNQRVVQCLVCGQYVRTSGGGGPYNPTWGMVAHAPGVDLIEPCEFHGWKQLTIAKSGDEDVVACRCKCYRPGSTEGGWYD